MRRTSGARLIVAATALATMTRSAPAPACSAAVPVLAVRVSGEHADGHRPWFYVYTVPGDEEAMLAGVGLWRVRACAGVSSCPDEPLPFERAGLYVRPTRDLPPGTYRWTMELGERGSRRRWTLSDFEVRGTGPRAFKPPGPLHAFADYDSRERGDCGRPDSPDLYVTLDAWKARQDELRGRLLLIYDRRPNPAHPLVGVVSVVSVHDKIMRFHRGWPEFGWRAKRLPEQLWIAAADDDGGITAAVRVRTY